MTTDTEDSKAPAKEAQLPAANGESAEQSASEESAQQVVGDISAGSGSDISRPGSVDPTKDASAGHGRTYSARKAPSFRPVSVTKTFLAKSAVSIPSVRAGEKGTWL